MKPKPPALVPLNRPLALVHHTLSALAVCVHPTQAFGTTHCASPWPHHLSFSVCPQHSALKACPQTPCPSLFLLCPSTTQDKLSQSGRVHQTRDRVIYVSDFSRLGASEEHSTVPHAYTSGAKIRTGPKVGV